MNKFFVFLGLILSVIIAVSVFSMVIDKGTRTQEAEATLHNAMEQSLDDVMKDSRYKEYTPKEFMTAFTLYLSKNINSDMDIDVQLVKTDVNNGLLCIKVTGTYNTKDINPEEKTVTEFRTIVLNAHAPAPAP